MLPICAELVGGNFVSLKRGKEMFLSDAGIEAADSICLYSVHTACSDSYLISPQAEPEVRAWTIKKGTKGSQAAGKIHSDFERGFIRAEVISFDELMACGSMQAAKERQNTLRGCDAMLCRTEI